MVCNYAMKKQIMVLHNAQKILTSVEALITDAMHLLFGVQLVKTIFVFISGYQKAQHQSVEVLIVLHIIQKQGHIQFAVF